ncbi:MAG: hypothetical protein ACOYKJ_06215 [Candidatus Howiella sp.]|jgi:hypothetical protein
MNTKQIRDRLDSLISFFGFDYNGKACGVDPISHTHFEMWCGNDYLVAKSIDEVMSVSLFNGKSLAEIADDINITDM